MYDIYLTSIIATYGAVIATLSFLLALGLGIHEIRKDRAVLDISIDYGTLSFFDNKFSEPFLLVKAVNKGKGKIVINSFGFLMKDGSSQVIVNPYILKLPHELEERRSCTAGYAVRWFKENKRKDDVVAVFMGDETGKRWKTMIPKKKKRKWLVLNQEGIKIDWSPKLQMYYREDYEELVQIINLP